MDTLNTNLSYEYFFPMLVSSWEDSADSNEETLARWATLKTVSERAKNILLAEETAKSILSICTEFNLSVYDGQEIARVIRDMLFGKFRQESLVTEIKSRFDIENPRTIQLIAKAILDKIINAEIKIESGKETAPEIVQKIQLTLADVLKAYPEIGEQLVTSDRIKILSFPEPARPSVKNWLADYTSVLGHENHSSIVRGNYLFHNANTSKLNSNDRQKLAYILKSFDEKTTITINKEAKQIIFPAYSPQPTTNLQAISRPNPNGSSPAQFRSAAPAEEITYGSQIQRENSLPKTQTTPASDNSNIRSLNFTQTPSRLNPEKTNPQIAAAEPQSGRVSFSSPQKLPYEKITTAKPVFVQPQPKQNPIQENPVRFNAANQQARPTGPVNKVPAQPFRITPVYGREWDSDTAPNDARALGKNVVNLRDN